MNGSIAHPQDDAPEPNGTNHLRMARVCMDAWQGSVYQDKRTGDPVERQRYEDVAYKNAMLHACIAQAEAATRQAEVMEQMLESVAEFVDKTKLIDSLVQWGERQGA
ncbi:MAG: hypothetical protein IT328_23015 [Caldilineaceae bacterium]|nr:hypothetical protein [Caldilineaceae bacterium]